MKTIHLFILIMMLLAQKAWCNNVQVSNVYLTGQNTANDFTLVNFSVAWENSWRYANGPSNWDAVWVFVKYRIGAGPWLHASLNNTGHITDSWVSLENGLLTPGAPFNSTTNPVMGVFLYRNAPGTGSFLGAAQLRWNYGANGVADNAEVDIKVFAIEMVYVPQGNFYVGSGGSETGAFYTYPNAQTPFLITSESPITVGAQTGNIYYPNPNGQAGDQAGPIPAAFPKGYAAFYAMKYEISQLAYVDFLNTLTRQQQINRVRTNLTNQQVPERFVMTSYNDPDNRSSISCRQSIPPVPGVVDFFCDLNNNTIPNENNDGQNLACNYLKYTDMSAYLDWAALRLMTEFEFEKCGRGPLFPIAGEFAWGDNSRYGHLGLLNSGSASEIPNDYVSNTASDVSAGPLRTGAFARTSSNRTRSGAGYYGCLELTSNAWERSISVGNLAGRNYTGVHGNGILDAGGNEDVSAWPTPASALGLALRGGSYNSYVANGRLSDRDRAAMALPEVASYDCGGRGVRTAQ